MGGGRWEAAEAQLTLCTETLDVYFMPRTLDHTDKSALTHAITRKQRMSTQGTECKIALMTKGGTDGIAVGL